VLMLGHSFHKLHLRLVPRLIAPREAEEAQQIIGRDYHKIQTS